MSEKSGYLRHFHACNRHNMGHFRPFYVDGHNYGWVCEDLAKSLPHDIAGIIPCGDGITFANSITDFATRSGVFAEATNHISKVRNKPIRNEMYPLVLQWGDAPLAQLDRVAVPWFGVRAFGVHVNGFVRKKDGIYIWVGERALDRRVDPGKLDNMIGGGQPIGLSIRENLRKEAMEEAGIVPALIDTAKHVRTMRYRLERNSGLRNDTLFIFDLELAEDFVPQNTDNEVAAFHLLPAAEVATIIHDTDHFKFNCNMVIVDFLVRHGHIGPTHPEYQALMSFLERDKAEHMAITSRADLPSA